MLSPQAPLRGPLKSLLLGAALLGAAARLEAASLAAAGFSPVNTSSLTVNWSSTFGPGTTYYALLSTGPLPNSFAGNASSSTLNFYAAWNGLGANEPYYARVSTDPAGPYTDLGSTTTATAAPGFAANGTTFSAVTASGLVVYWSSGTPAGGYDVGGTTYALQVSTMPGFVPLWATAQTTATWYAAPTGLNPNTTYFAAVGALNPAGVMTALTVLGSTSTLAAPPGPPGTSTFSAVTISALTVRWSSGGAAGYDPPGTVYVLQLSTMASFVPLWASSQTTTLSQSFSGLAGNTAYYAQVQALHNSGGGTAFASLGSTVTSVNAGISPAGFFNVGVSSLTAAWTSAFPSGTTYYATVSTGPLPNSFSGNLSSSTLNLYAAFAGLTPNATYYARTSTAAAGPYSDLGLTSTLAAPPGGPVGVATFTALTAVGIQVNWSSGTAAGGYNAPGTTYLFQAARDPAFSQLIGVVQTTATFFGTASGLNPDTTYYAQVAAIGNNGQQSGFTNLGSTSTLAVAPGPPAASTFTNVGIAALTVSWSSGTAASGYDGAGAFYVAQVSTMASFNPVWASSQTANLAASFSNLAGNKTYYAQVQALNNNGGATAFLNLGSTVTSTNAGISPAGFSSIGSGGLTTAWTSAFAPGTTYYAAVSSGPFPNSFTGNLSSNTLNLYAAFAALTPDTTYFAAVATAAAGPYTDLGSAVTVAAAPAPAAGGTFTSVSTIGFTANWSSGTAATGYNPAGSGYVLQVATDPGFLALYATVQTTALSAGASSGLSLDTSYYVRAAAVNNDGSLTPYTNLGATSTLAVPPSGPVGASTFSFVFSSSFTVSWSSGTAGGGYDPPGAIYLCQVSAAPGFSPVTASSQTSNLFAAFTGLAGNTTYYAQVQAISFANAGTAFVSLGSTLTLPSSGLSPAGFSSVGTSSLTVSWTSGFPAGTTYYAQVSSGAFPNAFSGNVSSATLNLFATFTGVPPATLYYVQASTAAGAGPYYALGSSATLAAAPASPSGSTFTSVSATGLTLNWSSGTAAVGYDPAGTSYLAQLSTTPSFNPAAASSQTYNLSASFSGLSGNATYYAQVQALNPAGTATPFSSFGSTMTPAAAPAAPPAPFSLVAATSVTVSWTSAGNSPGTTYYAQISAASNFSPVLASSQTYNLSAVFQGLAINATYYARAAAYSVALGTWTSFTSLQSTVTWTVPPAAPAGSTFTAVSPTGLTLSWSSGTAAGGYDPPGTLYLAQVSPAVDFSAQTVSSQTYNLSAAFAGLGPNATYYAQVQALNAALVGSGFTGFGSTTTPAAVPAALAGASTFSALSSAGLTVNWSSGTPAGGYNPAGTLYTLQLSTSAGFSPLAASSQTYNLSAAIAGLGVNTTYYAQVAAVANGGGMTAFASLGSTATLAVAPAAPLGASTFTAVFSSSLTVSWSSGTPAGGYDPAGTLYVAQLSTSPTFWPLAASSQTANLSAVLLGLSPLTTYYAQVAALNADAVASPFTSLGSTETANGGLIPAGFSAVASSGLSVAWTSAFPNGTPYYAQLSTGPLPNAFTGNQSSSTLNLFAAFAGLGPNAGYYAQVSTAASGPFTSLGSTQTLAVAPTAPVGLSSFTAVGASSFTLNWSSGTQASGYDPAGTLYLAQISTMPGFAPVLASSQTAGLSATFTGLPADATYFAEVQAANAAGTPTLFTSLGSTATPAALPGAASPVFSAVAISSLTLSWTSGGNASGTTYYAQISTMPSFVPILLSSQTANLSASFAGLSPNATCFARAAAYDVASGTWTAFAALGSTTTLAAPPTAAVPAFSAVSPNGLTVSWSSGTPTVGYDPAGTVYLAQVSTAPDFSALAGSSQTYNLNAAFAGLNVNATYYAQVQAFNSAAVPTSFAALGSTATWAVPPAFAAGVGSFTAVGTGGLTVSWASGTAAGGFNPAGTAYVAQLSTMASFSPLAASSQTYNLSAAFSGLNANATYYAQVEALNAGSVPSAFTGFGSTITLAVAPAAPVGLSGFSAVQPSSFTLNWSSGTPAGGYDPPGTQFVAQVSTMPGFVPLWASSQTANLSAAFTGLAANATYYAQAAALNGAGATTAFTALGSTITPAAAPGLAATSFVSVTSGSLSAAWTANGDSTGTLYYAQLSATPSFASILASSQTANLSAAFPALGINATYYAQVAAYSLSAGTWTAFTPLGSTSTLAVAPAAPAGTPAFSAVFASSLTVSWSSGTAAGGYDPPGTAYVAQLSTMASFTPLWASSQTLNLSAAFTSLLAGVTYYAQVQALDNAGVPTAFAGLGSTMTAPAGLILPAAFSSVGSAGLTANWLSSFAAGTTYYAVLSTGALPNAFSGNLSSNTLNAYAGFAGLAPNATYYAQTSTAAAGPYTALGSTVTLAVAPAAPVGTSSFTSVFVSSLAVNWSSGTAAGGYDPPGTAYVVELSTTPGFSPVWASSQTFNVSAGFSGLLGSVTYYAQVQALNSGGTATAFVALGSTITRAGPPGAASPAFSAVGSGGLTVAWIGNSPPQTSYYAQISTMASFTPILASSQTLSQSASFAGLSVNATYYAQAAAYDVASATWTAFTALGSTSTLAVAPGQPASTFTAVSGTALTVAWSSGTQAGGYDPPGTTYLAQLSTTPGFSAISASSMTLSLSASFTGLSGNATYYAQAAAFNNNMAATAFTALGSTMTPVLAPASLTGASTFSAVSQSGLTVSWSSGTAAGGFNAPGTAYVVQLSTMAGFSPLTASSQTFNLSAAFSSLSASATYYAQVQALGANGAATAFVALGSTQTLGGVSPAGFSGVSAGGLTVAWQSAFAPGTLYYAQLSSAAFPNAFAGNQSSNTLNTFAAFAGLAPDTTYYLQVTTAPAGPFWPLGSTATLAAPPGPPAGGAVFSSLATTGLTLAWSSGTAAAGYNPPGTTLYLAQVSTAPGFSPPAASSQTYNLSAAFAGLTADATYYAQVQAFNAAGLATAFTALGSTSTLAAPPGPAASTFTAVSGNALTVNWSSGTAAAGYNAAGTLYLAQLSTAPAFAPILASSQTAGLSAAFSGLAPNAVYFAQVQAINNNGVATAFVGLGSTATPTAVPGVAAFSSVAYTSVTVNWLSNGNPAGTTYYVQLSTAAGFSPVLASTQTTSLAAVFAGLGLNTTYYAQAAAYSLNTSTWTAFTSLGAVSTLAAPPAAPALAQVGVSSLSFTWSAAGNPPWTTYVAVLSTDNFVDVAASTQALGSSATFYGLLGNATYFLEVQALSGGGLPTAFAALPSTWTAVAPPSSAAPANVAASSVTVNWGANGNASTTLYVAQLSTDSAFATLTASTGVFGGSAAFGGLSASTTYYARVQALGNNGQATAFTVLPATTTLLLPPAAAAAAFPALSITGLTAAWSAGGNGPGTAYSAQLSTDNFATVDASSVTLNLSAAFAALQGNTTYYARVQTIGGGNASAFLSLGSTSTLAAPPGPAASTFTAVSGNALTVNWSSGTAAAGYNAAGTLYLAQLSTAPAFAPVLASSQTAGLSAAFSGLGADAVYYAQVQAINNNGVATAFVGLGSTATPAAAPGFASFSAVAYTSVTVNWLSNGNPAGTTYYVQLSTAAGFSPVLASTQTTSLAAVFAGLGLNTTYYPQAAAYSLNTSTWTAFTSLGAVSTLAAPPAAPALAQVGVSSLSFTWSAGGNPPWTTYVAVLSTDNFVDVAASTQALGSSATFYGLLGNATYFLEVQALNGGGLPTAFAALPSTWTAVAPPSSAAPANVAASSVTVNWGANGNAATTLYLAQASADGFASIAASTQTFGTSAALSGLLANTPYAFRVQALGNGGQATAFTILPATTTLLLPPAAAAAAFGAVSTSSVTVLWAAGGNGPGTSYNAQVSTDNFATVNAASSTLNLSALFGAGGQGPALAPNTTYFARVQAAGGGNASAFIFLGSTMTLAAPPTGTAVSGVAATSATVSWSLGANPAATLAQVQQSTDGVSYASIFSAAATSLADGGLLQCTTYWVRVRNLNGAGLFTAFDGPASFVTLASTPAPAIGLAAAAVSANHVALTWTPSPSEGITGYRLFYDAGSGVVNYAAPLAVLTSTESSFTTGVLTSSAAYVFALRARNRCGVEETAGVFASAGSTGTLAALRAAVTGPDSGKHIAGNAVSVVAGLSSGTPDRVASILFQYRPTGAAAWTSVVSADASHPNPAVAQPFYTHWDVTGLAPGAYDLRAVASDVAGSTDSTPSGITVVVDPVSPDISETVVGGQTKKVQTINTAVANVIEVAGSGADNLLTKIVMPAGALTASTVAVTVTSNYTLPSQPPVGVSVISNAMQVSLSNGQSLLAGGLTAPVTLSYPGLVASNSVLQIYTLNEGTGKWSKDFASTVDPVSHTVTGNTPHFSVFVIVNAGQVMPDLSRVRVWPNPFKPFGGNPDEGKSFTLSDPTSGIVFDNLPMAASLRIYTITGQLVAHFDSSNSNGRIQWDARNDAGHDVASGVYIAVITSPGLQAAVRKVAILR